jgi:N,N'-diacetyllegionaminate synthase
MNDPRVHGRATLARKTTVIAEIGENHLGDMQIAEKMVELAKDAGADYAKFQSYRGQDFPRDDPEFEWFQQVSLSDQDHHRLRDHCNDVGIKFLSAPATIERARFLIETLHAGEIKVASNRLRATDLLTYLGAQKLSRIFLSTGNGTLDDVQKAISLLATSGAQIVPLHCVSLYPTSPAETNLLSIPYLAESLHTAVGYSDHTVGTLACETAVSVGATVIEKHFTLDKAWPGTDHIVSCDPADLAYLIRRVEQIELMLGQRKKEPTARETSELSG